MYTTPEKVKIERELEKRNWSQLEKEEKGTGYKKQVSIENDITIDYVLYVNNRPKGIVNFEIDSKNLRNSIQKVKNDAKNLTKNKLYQNKYTIPFIFSSDGEDIIMDDLREGTQDTRYIRTYYSPEDIIRKERNNTQKGLQWLKDNTYESTDKELWDNQIEALKNIKQSINNNKQNMFITMPHGTGKKRLSLALVYQLLQSKYTNRILFLSDTNKDLNKIKHRLHSYDPIGSPKFANKYIINSFNDYISNDNSDVVVSTIQKVYHELKQNNYQNSSGEFDIIIFNNSQSKVYNKDGYGKVFDFFDSIKIEMNSVLVNDKIKSHKEEVYHYSYNQAVEDKKILPINVHKISTRLDINKLYPINNEEDEFYHKELNITEEIHKKVARNLINSTDIKNELTVVFAQNINHANDIVRDFREVYDKEHNIKNSNEFVKKITIKDRHAEYDLENFKDKRKNPNIVVTVNMFNTGINIRPLKNLVFFRKVESKRLFVNMLSHGMRTAPDKNYCNVFDCVDIIKYHREDKPIFNI